MKGVLFMKKIKFNQLNKYETVLRNLPLFFTLGIFVAFKGYRLYFNDIHLSLGYFESFLVMTAAFCFVQFAVNSNNMLRTTKLGIAIGTLLTVETVCFILFAQYHILLSVLIIFSTVFLSIKLKKYIFNINKDRIVTFKQKRFCSMKSHALITGVICLILIIPSVIGIYDEYYKDSLSAEEWAAFVEWFNEGKETESEPKEIKSIPSVLEGIDKWDKQSKKDKERIVRAVALLEKEHFGIPDDIEIVITTEKLEDGLYGYYDHRSKVISVNFEHLNESELKDVLKTILHEMHHAYVYYTVSTIDFSDSDVKNNLYYQKAWEWKRNTENYISSSQGYEKYKNQPIEVDARAYAEERVEYYLEMAKN